MPPILQLAKEAKGDKRIIVGYRDSHTFLREDLERYGKVYIATEDGSVGTKGNVMNAVEENGLDADLIYACGPMPMLRAVKAYAEEHGIKAYISLEIDHHSNVHNARICTDGPVFEAADVLI